MAVKSRRSFQIRLTRDLFLYVLGIAIIVNEVWFTTMTRPEILILAATLVGLPVFLRRNGM